MPAKSELNRWFPFCLFMFYRKSKRNTWNWKCSHVNHQIYQLKGNITKGISIVFFYFSSINTNGSSTAYSSWNKIPSHLPEESQHILIPLNWFTHLVANCSIQHFQESFSNTHFNVIIVFSFLSRLNSIWMNLQCIDWFA